MATGKCTHTSLMLVNFDDRFAFTCNRCRDLGYSSCYTCHPQCNYHLHKDCHMPQSSISHPFFEQGQFLLNQDNGPRNLSCEACGMIVGGWRYALAPIKGGSEISIHPCCMTLPHSHAANGAAFILTKKLETHNLCCAHCRQSKGVEGWAYVLATSNLAFHVKCIKEMHHQNWERNYCNNNNNNNSNVQNGRQQQEGLNQRHFRKRDLVFGAIKLAFSIMGLGGADDMMLIMVDLASNIWGKKLEISL